METATITDTKEIILRLIKEDFKMICLWNQFGALGFNGDFPVISYEVWDLMGISQQVQDSKLGDQYWEWALASASQEDGLDSYIGWVYDQLLAKVE